MRECQINEVVFLQELKKSWDSFGLFKRWVSRLFHHHNKKIDLIKNQGRSENTDVIALREFRTNIYLDMKRRLNSALITVWTKIRDDEERDNLISLLVSSFRLLDQILDRGSIERKEFFDKINDSIQKVSEEFYTKKLKEWNTEDCGSYFEWLSKFSTLEEDTLNQVSEVTPELGHIAANIRNKFYNILIVSYKPTLVSSSLGFQHLLTTNNYQALRNIKKLLTLYRDDMTMIYDAYKKQISNMINEHFDDYIKQINSEMDEKQQKKLKVVN